MRIRRQLTSLFVVALGVTALPGVVAAQGPEGPEGELNERHRGDQLHDGLTLVGSGPDGVFLTDEDGVCDVRTVLSSPVEDVSIHWSGRYIATTGPGGGLLVTSPWGTSTRIVEESGDVEIGSWIGGDDFNDHYPRLLFADDTSAYAADLDGSRVRDLSVSSPSGNRAAGPTRAARYILWTESDGVTDDVYIQPSSRPESLYTDVVYEDVSVHAPSGSGLGTFAADDRNGSVVLGDIDGSPLRTLAVGTDGEVSGVAMHPDGSAVAYVDAEDVYVVSTSGGEPRPIAADATVAETDPRWLPDGRLRVRVDGRDVHVIDVDTLEVDQYEEIWPADFGTVRSGILEGCPVETWRLPVTHPYDAAAGASRVVFDMDEADYVVLVRAHEFADALAGAALANDGPLLFADEGQFLPYATEAELPRVLPEGGLVYLVGGEEVLSPSLEDALAEEGYEVRRLGGPTRVETAIAVADEITVRNPGSTVALARAHGTADDPTAAWADSIAGGVWAAQARVPLLLTPTDSLHPAVSAAVQRYGTTDTVVLGGTQALSDDVAAAVPGPRRIAGPDRAGTAAAVAEQLFGSVERASMVDGYADDGWAFGLGITVLAAADGAPLLFSADGALPPATHDALGRCDLPDLDVTLAGTHEQMTDGLVSAINNSRNHC